MLTAPPVSATSGPVPTPGGLDSTAALRLLLANRGMLIGYINAITGDPTLTEDVFQEVSIVVLEKCAQLQDVEGFKPWSRTIARFQSLKAVNRRSAGPIALGDDLLDLIDRQWQTVDKNDDHAEALTALRQCLTRISPRAKQLVRMRYHENLPGARIAEILGQPINTVYVTISRIHRSLAECVRQRIMRADIGHAG
jgi:RNA polymerase sigma-70 factor (ECF subfamily)